MPHDLPIRITERGKQLAAAVGRAASYDEASALAAEFAECGIEAFDGSRWVAVTADLDVGAAPAAE